MAMALFVRSWSLPRDQGRLDLAAVDWNKDGKMDLVVANSAADAAHSVSILLGNGDGTFQPHHDIAGAPNANSIAVGDFNGDGHPDIATSSNTPVNAVYVSLGNGKGGVTATEGHHRFWRDHNGSRRRVHFSS